MLKVFSNLLLLLCFGLSCHAFSLKNNREHERVLWHNLIRGLSHLKPDGRPRFLLNCTKSNACSTLDIGRNGSSYSWQLGTTEKEKARFAKVYNCFHKQDLKLCPVDGHWSSWSVWEKCPAPCGQEGNRTRKRSCDNPAPINEGLECGGQNVQTIPCKGECTKGNHTGVALEEAEAYVNKTHVSYPVLKRLCLKGQCTYNQMELALNHTSTAVREKYWGSLQCFKYHRACPIDGGWSVWSPWTECSPKCGAGSRWRHRHCSSPRPENGGMVCHGQYFLQEPCVGVECKKDDFLTDNYLSPWTHFSTCSQTCGRYGTQQRRRVCLFPGNCTHVLPPNQKELVITRPCYNGPCFEQGQWMSWSDFTVCSSACGPGRQIRSRSCGSSSPIAAPICEGSSIDVRLCNSSCADLLDNYTKATNGSEFKVPDLSIPPDVSRRVISQDLGSTFKYEVLPSFAGIYSAWSQWSSCSKTCDGGVAFRKRTCKQVPVCFGETSQIRPCHTHKCPVNGGWGEWLEWTACSQTCGPGTRVRYRRCDSPLPEHGGTCLGEAEVADNCLVSPCDGAVPESHQWSDWGTCSKTCGVGSMSRQRNCLSEASDPLLSHLQTAKKLCPPDSNVETRACAVQECPVDGQWSRWASWSECSASCGEGVHFRDRTCSDPAPYGNGTSCVGPGSEVTGCFQKPCNVMHPTGAHFNKTSWIRYESEHKPTPTLSIYIRFYTEVTNGYILRMDKECIHQECYQKLGIDLEKEKVRLKLEHEDSVIDVYGNSAVKLKEWNSVYIYLTSNGGFMRVNEGPHIEALFDKNPKHSVNFDGYITLGASYSKDDGFFGVLSEVVVNMKALSFARKIGWSGYGSPGDSLALKTVPIAPEAALQQFTGDTIVKLPLYERRYIQLKINLFLRETSGLVFLNKGNIPHTAVHMSVRKQDLMFCLQCGETPATCEVAATLKLRSWYQVSVSVFDNMAEVRVNNGSAVKMTSPGAVYHPGSLMYIGQHDIVGDQTLLTDVGGFVGSIYDVTINGIYYRLGTMALLDKQGLMTGMSTSYPYGVTDVMEHRDSDVILLCDYTRLAKMGYNVSVYWFHADTMIKSNPKELITVQVPGEGKVSTLALAPRQHDSGVFYCMVNVDGHLINTQAYNVWRHRMKMVFRSISLELTGLRDFLIIFICLLILSAACAGLFSFKAHKRMHMFQLLTFYRQKQKSPTEPKVTFNENEGFEPEILESPENQMDITNDDDDDGTKAPEENADNNESRDSESSRASQQETNVDSDNERRVLDGDGTLNHGRVSDHAHPIPPRQPTIQDLIEMDDQEFEVYKRRLSSRQLGSRRSMGNTQSNTGKMYTSLAGTSHVSSHQSARPSAAMTPSVAARHGNESPPKMSYHSANLESLMSTTLPPAGSPSPPKGSPMRLSRRSLSPQRKQHVAQQTTQSSLHHAQEDDERVFNVCSVQEPARMASRNSPQMKTSFPSRMHGLVPKASETRNAASKDLIDLKDNFTQCLSSKTSTVDRRKSQSAGVSLPPSPPKMSSVRRPDSDDSWSDHPEEVNEVVFPEFPPLPSFLVNQKSSSASRNKNLSLNNANQDTAGDTCAGTDSQPQQYDLEIDLKAPSVSSAAADGHKAAASDDEGEEHCWDQNNHADTSLLNSSAQESASSSTLVPQSHDLFDSADDSFE